MSFIARIWVRELLGSVLNDEELNEEIKRINAMDEEEFSEYVKTLGRIRSRKMSMPTFVRCCMKHTKQKTLITAIVLHWYEESIRTQF